MNPSIRTTLLLLWLTAGMAAGAVLLAASFDLADNAAAGDNTHFYLFWAAVAAALPPAAAIAASKKSSSWMRWTAVFAAGVATTAPKMLRTWDSPLFSDEFGHMYQVRRVLRDGMFAEGVNPLLKVAQDFPLLHWLTAALTETGLPLWDAALLVTAVAHLVTVAGVAALVCTVTGSRRAGAVGALVYMLQPGWLFFSSQFAYETLGLPVLVWALVATLRARITDGPRRTLWLAGTVLLAVAAAFTHHAASSVLAGMLILLTVAGLSKKETRLNVSPADIAVATLSVAFIGFWLTVKYTGLADYYGPTVSSGFDRLSSPFRDNGTRRVFEGSPAPRFEQLAGLMLPFTLGVLALVSVVTARTKLVGRHVHGAFTLLAASFYLSLPLLFTIAGSEPAHRWWAYAYLGFAVVLAVGLPDVLDKVRATRPGQIVPAAVGMFALLAVTAVGGVAAGTTVGYRFPGPPEIGNDARSVTEDAERLATLLLTTEGPGVDSGLRVLADRFSAQQLVGWGEQVTSRPSPKYPAWNLLFSDNPSTVRALASSLVNDRVAYVVVDQRMATDRPVLGYWFNRTEPAAFSDTLVPQAALAKFDCADWSKFIAQEGPLRLYRIDPAVLARSEAPVC